MSSVAAPSDSSLLTSAVRAPDASASRAVGGRIAPIESTKSRSLAVASRDGGRAPRGAFPGPLSPVGFGLSSWIGPVGSNISTKQVSGSHQVPGYGRSLPASAHNCRYDAPCGGPRGIGSTIRPGPKRHTVDGGSAEFAFSLEEKGAEAKGARIGRHRPGIPFLTGLAGPTNWDAWSGLGKGTAPGLIGRFGPMSKATIAAFDSGMRLGVIDYSRLRGQGSIPVTLPPPLNLGLPYRGAEKNAKNPRILYVL